MSEDITYSDWSDRLDAGTSHWLPAYGFQQPSQLQEALLQQQDYMNHDGGSQQTFIFLETILEETSDDLRSESDYSGTAGWPDSDADSVIHVPNALGKSCAIADWSGSERDIAVPKKKRRTRQLNNDPGVHDEDDEFESYDGVEEEYEEEDEEEVEGEDPLQPTVASRSSSLLQFETLERHCETAFRTSASSEPFPLSPSVGSSFSFDSLETSRWRFSGSGDSFNEEEEEEEEEGGAGTSLSSSCSSTSSDLSSTDEDNIARSFSSRSGNGSFRSSTGLKSHRSFDSLVSSQSEKLENSLLSGEFSQSLNNNSIPPDEEPEQIAPSRPFYKTMECLSEVCVTTRKSSTKPTLKPSSIDNEKSIRNGVRHDSTGGEGGVGVKFGGQRSAENLSEDSGFGEHIPKGSLGTMRRASSSGVFTIEEKEDNYGSSSSYGSDISSGEKNGADRNAGVSVKILPVPSGEAKERGWDDVSSNFSGYWQSAPDLLKPGSRGTQSGRERAPEKTYIQEVSPSVHCHRLTTSLVLFTIKDDDELIAIPENKSFAMEIETSIVPIKTGNKKALPTSTPNLYSPNEYSDEENESLHKMSKGTSHLSRSHSFKHASEKEKIMVKSSSRGSNVQITTSFINLTTTNSGSNKGVHFCPVVSEVMWQDSYSDGDEESSKEENKGETIWVTKPEMSGEEIVDGEGENELEEVERRRKDTGADEEEATKVERRTEDCGGVGRGEDPTTVTTVESPVSAGAPTRMEQKQNKGGRFGGFFQRFSLRRLSGRDKKRKEKKKEAVASSFYLPTQQTVGKQESPLEREEDVRIIPLHPPPGDEEDGGIGTQVSGEAVGGGGGVVLPSGKPPLPPLPPRIGRKRNEEGAAAAAGVEVGGGGGSVMTSRGRAVLGLLETDIDSPEPASNKKARSLLDLGETHLTPCPPPDQTPDNRAKSMEFLLDKENQHAVQPPENELQKVGGGERVMSEHQLRVQRSLQKLDIPDWYKNTPLPAQGFLLKRNSDTTHWPGLSSKTTSLSSLGSAHSATPRSPTSNLLSPSPTPSVHTFSRWSTSRLNSNPTSTSTSPCGSARSSFNYRQPYLGWRSQERISRPRTPAERLAAGLLPQKPQPQYVPNLSEVHTSIKEVTSAIASYVSGTKGSDDRLSPGPRWDATSSRSASPRGSTGRLCWLESSFVGSRPIDVPETPVTLTSATAPDHPRSTDLYLDLTPTNRPKAVAVNGTENSVPGVSVSGSEGSDFRSRPSPGSTTMEDVLDSLLGLPPASRSPSPNLSKSGSTTVRRSCGDLTNHLQESASIGSETPNYLGEARRHSEGCDGPNGQPPIRTGRRVSFDKGVSEGDLVKCRYSKCGKVAPLSEARKTFKTCHNCTHVYCSRECRRAHWEKHRKTCLHSRVGALCRKVISSIKDDEETLHHMSLLARRGFLSRGRGAVKVFFSSTENAEAFVIEGFGRLGDPTFVRWPDILPDETGQELHEELLRLCKSYNPETRLVIYVAVCVVSEVPTTGAVKWERQLVSRSAKLRLSRRLVPQNQATITRDNNDPETLILTSLPGARDQGSWKSRQISFTNIQRHLRQRGVSLRRHFPEIYQKLCAYVEGSSERFTPVTIYPRDTNSGKTFMCIIMPDAEPEKLELIPTDNIRVQTIDISLDPEVSSQH